MVSFDTLQLTARGLIEDCDGIQNSMRSEPTVIDFQDSSPQLCTRDESSLLVSCDVQLRARSGVLVFTVAVPDPGDLTVPLTGVSHVVSFSSEGIQVQETPAIAQEDNGTMENCVNFLFPKIAAVVIPLFISVFF